MRPKLEANLAMQRSLSIRAEILEPGDVARVEPAIATDALGAVLWEPESGYGDPTGVTLGYANAARARGVVIEQDVEVTAITVDGSEIYLTHRGMVEVVRGDMKDSTVWQPRPADPQLEAEIVSPDRSRHIRCDAV